MIKDPKNPRAFMSKTKKQPRILVVDDEATNLRLLQSILAREGYAVRAAPNGKSALQFIQLEPPDLILLDVLMPEMNGFEICQHLKSDPKTADIPIIFLSTLQDSAEKVRAFNAGGSDYVVKPFLPEELFARIETHLELRDLQKRLEERVTEQTEELHASEERYRGLFAGVPIGLFRTNSSGQILEANQSLVEMLGFPSLAILLQSNIKNLYVDLVDRQVLMEEIIGAGQVTGRLIHLRRYDGKPIWVEDHTLVVEREADQLIFEGALIDVTERKLAEDALLDSEERYRNLVENINDVIYWYEFLPDLRFAYVSPSVTRMTGYTPDEYYGDPQLGEKLIHPEDQSEMNRIYDLNKGQVTQSTLRWVRKDGRNIWIEQTNTPIYDDSGNLIAVEGLARDITSRKEAQDALKKSEDLFRAIVEDQTEFLVRWKPDGVRTFANDSYCQFYGLPKGEIVGKSFYPLIHAEDLQQVIARIKRLSISEPVSSATHRVVLPDASIGWQEWTDRAFFDERGEIFELQSVGRDITDRVRAEEKIRKAQLQLQGMFDNTPANVYAKNLDGRYIMVNREWSSRTGISSEQAVGKTTSELFPNDRKTIWNESEQRVLETSKPFVSEEVGTITDNTYLASIYLLFDDDGNPYALGNTSVDITERKRAEERQRESEIYYRTLFESATDCIFILDGEEIITGNQSALEMFKVSLDEFVGKTPFDFSPKIQPGGINSRETGLPYLAASQKGNKQVFEWVHARKDGTLFDTEISLTQMVIRDRPLVFAIVRDISARKLAEKTLRNYANRLEALHEIDRGILATQSPGEIAQFALGHLRRLIPCQRASVTLHDLQTQYAEFIAVDTDVEISDKLGERFPVNRDEHHENFTQYGIMQRSTAADELYEGGFKTYLHFPLLARQDLIGMLNLGFFESDNLSDEQHTIIRQVADQLAIALEQARLTQSETRQRLEAEALQDAGAALNSTLDLDEVLDQILDNLGRVVPHEAANITTIDTDGDFTRVVRQRGYAAWGLETAVSEWRFEIKDCPHYEEMLTTGNSVIISDTHVHNPKWARFWVRSYAGAPLRQRGEVVGFLNLDSGTPGYFNQSHAARLQSFADQAAVALENARLLDEAQEQAQKLVQQVSELEILAQLAIELRLALQRDDIIRAVVDRVYELFQAVAVSINTLDIPSQDIIMELSKGPGGNKSGLRLPAGTSISPSVTS
jgi:PAS domain S-box-containing protein